MTKGEGEGKIDIQEKTAPNKYLVQAASAKLCQLDRPHVVACLRSLTFLETVLLPSLNHVCNGTKFYPGNSVKLMFYSSTGELCTKQNKVERR